MPQNSDGMENKSKRKLTPGRTITYISSLLQTIQCIKKKKKFIPARTK